MVLFFNIHGIARMDSCILWQGNDPDWDISHSIEVRVSSWKMSDLARLDLARVNGYWFIPSRAAMKDGVEVRGCQPHTASKFQNLKGQTSMLRIVSVVYTARRQHVIAFHEQPGVCWTQFGSNLSVTVVIHIVHGGWWTQHTTGEGLF